MDITLSLPCAVDHCAQIVTGFMMLSQDPNMNINLKINDRRYKNVSAYKDSYVVSANIDGKRVIYDVMDGYQDPKGMIHYMRGCDYYFKRSYNDEFNRTVFDDEDQLSRIRPLGMNYSVMIKNNPYTKRKNLISDIKHYAYRYINLSRPNSYFTYDKFEEEPVNKSNDFKILFSTRLWEPPSEAMRKIDPDYYKKDFEWVSNLNENRINTIKSLRQSYGSLYIGGLEDTPVARELAPELIIKKSQTNKYKYLQTLHEVDICVGTLGLHKSTGWKTGEYVAASKAIVHEPFVYDVPGNFEDGVNYLSFTNGEELLKQVEYLMNNPDKVNQMKMANHEYYNNYLRPNKLIENTLKIITK